MKFFPTFLIVILLSASLAIGQQHIEDSRFAQVDAHVSTVSKQFLFHPQLLAQKLTENLTNDYDKVRAFYVWIAKNIEYDLLAYINDYYDGQSINTVLRSGEALCTGFSLLFKFFCDEANIEAEIIEGYAKGYGYKKGQTFEKSNHSWNTVNIYGRWYPLDVTWATGSPITLLRHEKKIDLNTFFLAEPEKFVKTHLPEDPSWQLLNRKISLTEFEKDEYQNKNEWDYNRFSPADYKGLDEYDKDILKNKRAILFNPINNAFKTQLSFAYVYKGISLTDELWEMDYPQLMDTVASLEQTFYAYMDSSGTIIEQITNYGLNKYSKMPRTKEIIVDEINYQKGVFNYELGAELFTKGMSSDIPIAHFNELTERYLKEAVDHFEAVTNTSIYHKDAIEYLSYIQEFRSRMR